MTFPCFAVNKGHFIYIGSNFTRTRESLELPRAVAACLIPPRPTTAAALSPRPSAIANTRAAAALRCAAAAHPRRSAQCVHPPLFLLPPRFPSVSAPRLARPTPRPGARRGTRCARTRRAHAVCRCRRRRAGPRPPPPPQHTHAHSSAPRPPPTHTLPPHPPPAPCPRARARRACSSASARRARPKRREKDTVGGTNTNSPPQAAPERQRRPHRAKIQSPAGVPSTVLGHAYGTPYRHDGKQTGRRKTSALVDAR